MRFKDGVQRRWIPACAGMRFEKLLSLKSSSRRRPGSRGVRILNDSKKFQLKETLNKSAFYGEPAQLCDAGINKINALTRLILPQKFTHLFNQRFLN
jgi:hypothetical protein